MSEAPADYYSVSSPDNDGKLCRAWLVGDDQGRVVACFTVPKPLQSLFVGKRIIYGNDCRVILIPVMQGSQLEPVRIQYEPWAWKLAKTAQHREGQRDRNKQVRLYLDRHSTQDCRAVIDDKDRDYAFRLFFRLVQESTPDADKLSVVLEGAWDEALSALGTREIEKALPGLDGFLLHRFVAAVEREKAELRRGYRVHEAREPVVRGRIIDRGVPLAEAMGWTSVLVRYDEFDRQTPLIRTIVTALTQVAGERGRVSWTETFDEEVIRRAGHLRALFADVPTLPLADARSAARRIRLPLAQRGLQELVRLAQWILEGSLSQLGARSADLGASPFLLSIDAAHDWEKRVDRALGSFAGADDPQWEVVNNRCHYSPPFVELDGNGDLTTGQWHVETNVELQPDHLVRYTSNGKGGRTVLFILDSKYKRDKSGDEITDVRQMLHYLLLTRQIAAKPEPIVVCGILVYPQEVYPQESNQETETEPTLRAPGIVVPGAGDGEPVALFSRWGERVLTRTAAPFPSPDRSRSENEKALAEHLKNLMLELVKRLTAEPQPLPADDEIMEDQRPS